MMRVSPPELARELPGPHASSKVTLAPFRSRWIAVQPPNAPAPTTATWGFRLVDANEVDIERAATFNRDLRFMRRGRGAGARRVIRWLLSPAARSIWDLCRRLGPSARTVRQ